AAAARAPRIVAPRLLGFFRPRHRQELPHLLAAGGVDTEDRTAAGPLTALGADDDLILHEQRRARETHGELLRVDELGVPYWLAGLLVDGDEPTVHGADEHLALPDGDAPRVRRMRLGGDEVVVELGEVGPHRLSGGRLQRPPPAVRP